MKHAMLWVAVLLAGCDMTPDEVATTEQPLTEGQVNALNNVGRETGITYQLVDPPEPDTPDLELSFAPVAELRRTSLYQGLAGGLSQTVTADPPGSAGPALPKTGIFDADAHLIVSVTGDPPGGAPVSVSAFGAMASGTLNFLSDRSLNFSFGNPTGRVVVSAAPPGAGDPPGSLNFTVTLVGSGTVQVYRDGATTPACTTATSTSPLTGGGG